MTRYKATPEGVVPFTAEEEAQADIDAAYIVALKAEKERTEYQRDRAAEYPPMTDYIDGIVKCVENSVSGN